MFRAHVLIIRRPKLQYTASRCDDTRDCVMQFWPPDDEHMCSKHVEAWNKLIVKQLCTLSWLITEINNILCQHLCKIKISWNSTSHFFLKVANKCKTQQHLYLGAIRSSYQIHEENKLKFFRSEVLYSLIVWIIWKIRLDLRGTTFPPSPQQSQNGRNVGVH